jgi:hypothetical protein
MAKIIDHKGQKSGPYSAEEKLYISDQAGKLSPELIAEKLSRNPKKIKDYMTKQGLMKYYYKEDLEKDQLQNIRKSRYWNTLSEQFSKDELDSFEYHWQNIVRQFRDDILHTEELQIVDAIKLQLMMDRNQKKQKQAIDHIDFLRTEIAKERKASKPDEKKIQGFSQDLAASFSGIEALDKDHVMLLKEKNNALQKLKATREQRVQQIENSKETLVGWVKQLYMDPKLRYQLGIDMEKKRIATQVEYQRLSAPHVYADGVVDRPILNHETVCMTLTQNNIEEIKDIELTENLQILENNV